MDIYRIKTFTNIWLKWYEINVEVDSSKSLPNIEIVWLPDTAIKESKERIKSTFRNLWIDLPHKKIILNLSPSNIKKIWTRFDLPMAVAVLLLVTDNIKNIDIINNSIFFGELWLDWSIKNIDWILPSVISAYKLWYINFFVPNDNIHELKYIKWINIYPISHFRQIMDFVLNDISIDFIKWWSSLSIMSKSFWDVDFSSIKWQYFVKRALSICVAWQHNILMIWPPWSWKTMLVKSLKSILPPLNFDEILEVSQIYSLIWKLSKDNPIINYRPFRTVHHTASKISIVWWSQNLLPWEISLAHKWVLFMDEFPEFQKDVLEVLRQPIEDKKIIISRANWSVEYPSNFMLVWTMNPCKCWFYKDQKNLCKCSILDVKRYQSRISWPLLDRFDMIIDVPRVDLEIILEKNNEESSEKIKEKVYKAREIQQKRFEDMSIYSNSQIDTKDIDKYVKLDIKAENFFKNAIKSLNLSPRLFYRILKLSRTIADIDLEKTIWINQIAEALQYRSKNYFISNDV
jgi:magnesium chelatase family protein